MVYHLGNSSHAKAYARHTTRHGLHDGIGKILGKRGKYKSIYGIVYIHNLARIACISECINGQVESLLKSIGMSTEYHDGCALCKIVVTLHVASIYKILHTLIDIRDTLCHKEYEFHGSIFG